MVTKSVFAWIRKFMKALSTLEQLQKAMCTYYANSNMFTRPTLSYNNTDTLLNSHLRSQAVQGKPHVHVYSGFIFIYNRI